MRRRSLNPRFEDKALADIKYTTIRDHPWLVGVPIMLFKWCGTAYRSKQIDIAVIIVERTKPIQIQNRSDHQPLTFLTDEPIPELWRSEGFNSSEELDAWFRPLTPPGQTITKHLMIFRRMTHAEIEALGNPKPIRPS